MFEVQRFLKAPEIEGKRGFPLPKTASSQEKTFTDISACRLMSSECL
jgi:hypothetical protein